MKNKKKKRMYKNIRLVIIFSLLFFLSFISSVSIVMVATRFFYNSNLPQMRFIPKHIVPYLIVIICIVDGVIFALTFSKYILVPLYNLREATVKVAEGDYTSKVTPKGFPTFKKLGQSFNNMVDEINGVETLRNDFINNFSHEFKTPIISIEGFAKILKSDKLTAQERNEYLDIIISESQRLAQLSSNILNLSRIEQQAMLTNIRSYNVTEQLRLVISSLDLKWSHKKIEIDFDSEEMYINADEELLKQLWINLLDNAYKFSAEKSTVTIKTHLENNRFRVLFTDQGKGMNEEEIKRAFDKFYQGDLSHSTKGNGIGLPIAKKICELHSGDITIHSDAQTGTTFEVNLPINAE